MADPLSGQPLPILVGHVADDGAREFLIGVAHARGSVCMPLLAPPANGSLHALEVYSATAREPAFLVAEPLGAPTGRGYPLRLRLRDGGSAGARPSMDYGAVRAASRAITLQEIVGDAPEASPPASSSGPWDSLVPSLGTPSRGAPRSPTNLATPPAQQSAIPAPAESDFDADDWLEHGAGFTSVPAQPMGGAPIEAAPPPPRPEARASAPPSNDIAGTITPFLQKLAQTSDPANFAALVAPLGAQMRGLLQQGQTSVVWRLCSTLELIARDPPGPLSRADHAKAALEVLRDPTLLAPLAEKALAGLDDREAFATKLVVRAAKRGARALYQARLKHDTPEARERFVALLAAIGIPALPVLTTALERLESRLAVPGALSIAEDLLRAVPVAKDDALARLVLRYAQHAAPTVAVPATDALVRVLGDQARPMLRAQLAHRADEVAMAALARLHVQGGIDAEVVALLRPFVLGTNDARPPLRLAAVGALASATPDARAAAWQLLAEALATPDAEDMTVAIAHTLLAFGDGARVHQRWSESEGSLRLRLEMLLRSAAPGRPA